MKSFRQCSILVATGFAEKGVSRTIELLQNSEVEPTFLNLFMSPLMDDLFAQYGINSALIGDMGHTSLPDGLLFAGGDACAQQFLIDPRVDRLVHQMYEAKKPIGYLYPVATPLAERLGQSRVGKTLLLQERLRLDQFLVDFIQQMPIAFPSYYQKSAALFL